MIFKALILAYFAQVVFSGPVPLDDENRSNEFDNSLMENLDMYQGDIAGDLPSNDKFATAHDVHLWPGRVIPYVITGGAGKF